MPPSAKKARKVDDKLEEREGHHIRNVKNLCMFCYKSTLGAPYKQPEDDEGDGGVAENDERTTIIDRLIKYLERYAGNAGNKISLKKKALASLSKWLDCCEDCKVTLDQISSLYHQLRCIELQLEWKLESLVKIMKFANRVPSRVQRLRRHFGEDICRRGDEESGEVGARLETFKHFRHGLIKTCSRKLAKSQPRVSLQRNQGFSAASTPSSLSPTGGNTSGRDLINPPLYQIMRHLTTEEELEVFTGLLMSFAVVALLAMEPISSPEPGIAKEIPDEIIIDDDTGSLSSKTTDMIENECYSVALEEVQDYPICNNNSSRIANKISSAKNNPKSGGEWKCNSVECHICKLIILNSDLERHFKLNHDTIGMDLKDVLKCDMRNCGAYFKTGMQMELHKEKVHKIIDLEIIEAPKINSPMPKSLKNKMKSNNKIQTILTRSVMNTQKKIKSGDNKASPASAPPPTCTECGLVFRSERNLGYHAIRHLGPDYWHHQCTMCPRKFAHSWELSRHMESHKAVFVCAFCDVRFGDQDQLVEHVREMHKNKWVFTDDNLMDQEEDSGIS